MKRIKILNKFLIMALGILIVLHILSLLSYFPSNILWDNLFKDTSIKNFSEIIIISFLLLITYLLIKNSKKLKFRKSQNYIRIIKVLLVYFFLSLIGILKGIDTTFKFVGFPVYSICLFLVLLILTNFEKVKRKFDYFRSINKAH